MKFNYLLAALLFFNITLPSLAQNTQTDSLKAIWLDESLDDTTRLSAIDKFAWEGYLFRNPDSAFIYAQQQYDFAEKMKSEKYRGAALNTQGVSFLIKGEFEEGRKYLFRSVEIRKKINDRFGLARAYMNLGTSYQRQGNFSQAVDYIEMSLKISETDNFTQLKSTALNNVGLIYIRQQNFDKALDVYNQSLVLADSIGDIRGLGNVHLNLGVVTRNIKKYDEALGHFEEALKYKKQVNDKVGISSALNNIGLIYFTKKDYPKAIDYQTQAAEIRKEINDQNGSAISLVSLGLTKIRMNDLRGSESDCSEALEIANKIKSLDRKKDAAECLYEVTEKRGDYKSSLKWYKDFISYKDSLDNRATTRRLQRMEINTQMVRDSVIKANKLREETLALEAKTNRRHSLQYTGIAIALFILVGWWFFASKLELPNWAINLSLFVPFLIFFRFISMLTYPLFSGVTQGEPLYEMLMSIVLASIITPTHTFFEKLVRVKILKVEVKKE